MEKIPCILFRGGTSKGPFFLKSDLPDDPSLRNKRLLSLMGSPLSHQRDGIGGGDSLSSKVAIIAPSTRNGIDVDYLFCQVHVDEPIVDTAVNCGNMLAAVAPFAITKGLVNTTHPQTTVKIYNENTKVVIQATVQTPNGEITYDGDARIDGIAGTSAPIKLSFVDPVGAKTGKLLPTTNVVDEIDDIPFSCVDVTVPMVITSAKALGKTGYESKAELDADKAFMHRLETLRQKAAAKMGFNNVAHSVCPKICIVSPPCHGGSIHSCYFTPFDCHAAHAVSGALCVAAASLIEGTIANQVAQLTLPETQKFEQEIIIEHVSGKITVFITVDKSAQTIHFPAASCIRTAQPLFAGHVFVRD